MYNLRQPASRLKSRDEGSQRPGESSEAPTIQQSRTAQWQAIMASADLRPPVVRTPSTALSSEAGNMMSPTGTGQPFFSSSSFYRSGKCARTMSDTSFRAHA